MLRALKNIGYVIVMLQASLSQAIPRSNSSNVPPRAVFFYGYPSLVNGANGDVHLAARAFAAYDIIVLGDGVEFSTMLKNRSPIGVGRLEHDRSKQIIASILLQNPHAEIFGYVCLGDSQSLSIATLKSRMVMWKALGVSGIFLDEAGYDWPIVTRSRQNTAIRLAHSLGMAAFLNAYHPETLTSLGDKSSKNPLQERSALTARDLILLESFPIKHGIYLDPPELQLRLQQALRVRQQFSTRVVALSTTRTDSPFREDQMDYACWNAWMFDLDAMAWGEPDFSSDNKLPERRCEFLKLSRNQLEAPPAVTVSENIFWRRTAEGIVILDIENKTVDLRRGQYQFQRYQLRDTRETRRADALSR
jgi:hypothetical protein